MINSNNKNEKIEFTNEEKFEDENGNRYEDITELDKDQQEKIREAFKKILDF